MAMLLLLSQVAVVTATHLVVGSRPQVEPLLLLLPDNSTLQDNNNILQLTQLVPLLAITPGISTHPDNSR